eukprot:16187-Heterococcus_DN1.PRE.1
MAAAAQTSNRAPAQQHNIIAYYYASRSYRLACRLLAQSLNGLNREASHVAYTAWSISAPPWSHSGQRYGLCYGAAVSRSWSAPLRAMPASSAYTMRTLLSSAVALLKLRQQCAMREAAQLLIIISSLFTNTHCSVHLCKVQECHIGQDLWQILCLGKCQNPDVQVLAIVFAVQHRVRSNTADTGFHLFMAIMIQLL